MVVVRAYVRAKHPILAILRRMKGHGCFAPTTYHDDSVNVIGHDCEGVQFNECKMVGMFSQHRRATSPASFNRISPFATWPNRHARSRVQIVTKYAPGWA